jgi:phosphoribosylaminoimidazole-succinocarboxamide synthase
VSDNVIVDTRLDALPLRSKGKVRDVYELDGKLLIVTTDRISAFDVVLPTGIPDKGKVLNQLSLYWFDRTRSIVPNHVIEGDFDRYPDVLAPFAHELRLRSMLVKKLEPVPFECVVRGYLYGSGWKEYQKTGSVCGIPLPKGLSLADRFEEPLFTPSTKATAGHDVNVSEEAMSDTLGANLTELLREIALSLYRLGSAEAESKGILIADTKFEFGLDPGTSELYLIDEVMTPDSSRFWPKDRYRPGQDQPSFDKQFVREYLESLDWDKTPPGPELPPDVVAGTRTRYLEAYRLLTGRNDLDSPRRDQGESNGPTRRHRRKDAASRTTRQPDRGDDYRRHPIPRRQEGVREALPGAGDGDREGEPVARRESASHPPQYALQEAPGAEALEPVRVSGLH